MGRSGRLTGSGTSHGMGQGLVLSRGGQTRGSCGHWPGAGRLGPRLQRLRLVPGVPTWASVPPSCVARPPPTVRLVSPEEGGDFGNRGGAGSCSGDSAAALPQAPWSLAPV